MISLALILGLLAPGKAATITRLGRNRETDNVGPLRITL
jgi:hypothetical protein